MVGRLKGGTAQAWEYEDPEMQRKARAVVPVDELLARARARPPAEGRAASGWGCCAR